MCVKELKKNHVVQIIEQDKCPITCLIVNIDEDYVDVEIEKDNKMEMLYQVPIKSIFPIDILECHLLSLGFIQQDATKYDLLGFDVYSLRTNKREVLIAKTDSGYYLLKWDGIRCKYIPVPPILTLHNLQNEISKNPNEIEKVDKDTFEKLSERYQIKILTPISKE